MTSLHAKSPCCQGHIIRFGGRRRQCVVCRRIWRVRKKQRGRKRLRRDTRLAVRYVRYILVAPRLSMDQRQRRLAASADRLQEDTQWLSLPVRPPLIAVADAVRVRAEKRVWTIYLILILIRRSCASRAWIAEPYMREGKESWQGWQDAFTAIPEKTRRAIATFGKRWAPRIGVGGASQRLAPPTLSFPPDRQIARTALAVGIGQAPSHRRISVRARLRNHDQSR